jgi:hypothetical protein
VQGWQLCGAWCADAEQEIDALACAHMDTVVVPSNGSKAMLKGVCAPPQLLPMGAVPPPTRGASVLERQIWLVARRTPRTRAVLTWPGAGLGNMLAALYSCTRQLNRGIAQLARMLT